MKITTAHNGEANGVVLASGQEIKSKLVLSNATPEITFNKYVFFEFILGQNLYMFK